MRKNGLRVLVLLVLAVIPMLAFAENAADALLEFVHQRSTDELLQLRVLIDEELEQRNAAVVLEPTYIVNTNSRKFHFPDCKSVKDIKAKNSLDFFGEKEELIAKEYEPCQKCKP